MYTGHNIILVILWCLYMYVGMCWGRITHFLQEKKWKSLSFMYYQVIVVCVYVLWLMSIIRVAAYITFPLMFTFPFRLPATIHTDNKYLCTYVCIIVSMIIVCLTLYTAEFLYRYTFEVTINVILSSNYGISFRPENKCGCSKLFKESSPEDFESR